MTKKKSNKAEIPAAYFTLGEYLQTIRKGREVERKDIAKAMKRDISYITYIENDSPTHVLSPPNLFLYLKTCQNLGKKRISDKKLINCLGKLDPPIDEKWLDAFKATKGYLAFDDAWLETEASETKRFGLYVKALMDIAHLKASRLTDYCGISSGFCSGILNGERPMNGWRSLKDGFKVDESMADFFTQESQNNEALKAVFNREKFERLANRHKQTFSYSKLDLTAVTPESATIGAFVPTEPQQEKKR